MSNSESKKSEMRSGKFLFGFALVVSVLSSEICAQQRTAQIPSNGSTANTAVEELADELIKSKSPEERERLIVRKMREWTQASVWTLIGRGQAFSDKKQYEEALRVFQIAQRIAEQINYPAGVVNALFNIGFTRLLQSDADSAIEKYNQGLLIAKLYNEQFNYSEGLRLLGELYSGEHRFHAALEQFHERLTIAERSKDQLQIALSAESVAETYVRQGNDSQAVTYYERAIQALDSFQIPQFAKRDRENLAAAYYRLANYREALRLYEGNFSFVKESNDKEQVAELLLQIADCYFHLKAIERIDRLLDQLEKIINELNATGKPEVARRIEARISQTTGNMLYQQGDFPHALTAYRRAQVAAERSKDNTLLAQALKGVGDAWLGQNNLELANESYERSLILGPESSEERATAFSEIAETYAKFERFSEASKYYLESLGEATKSGNKALIADVRSSLGGVYLWQGQMQQALKELDDSQRIYDELGNQHQVFLTLNKIGLIYYWNADFRSAAKKLIEGLKQARDAQDVEATAIISASLATNAQSQGNEEDVSKYLLDSLRAFTEIQDKGGMATAQIDLLASYFRQRKFDRAQQILNENKDALTALDGIGQIKLHMYSGMTSLAIGNFDIALQKFQECRELAAKQNSDLLVALSQTMVGLIYYLQEKPLKALKEVEEAAPSLAKSNNQSLYGQFRGLAGLVYQALGRDGEAQRAFEDAIRATEEGRANVAGLEVEQTLFFAQRIDPYHGMIQLLVKHNNVGEALAYGDRSKARVLLDMIQEHSAIDVTAAMNQQEQKQKINLELQLAALNARLFQEAQRGASNSSALSEKLQETRKELREFLSDFYVTHPELWRRLGGVRPFTTEDEASLLPDAKSALLEYVVTDDEIFLFVVTRTEEAGTAQLGNTTCNVYRIALPDDLAKTIDDFREMIAPAPPKQRSNAFKQPASNLYNLLVKPAERQLQGRTSLIIVPDGELWKLPFQALRTPAQHYLLEDCAISYAPSLAALTAMRAIRDQRSTERHDDTRSLLFALGDPNFGEALSPTANQSRTVLARLPESAEEVNELGRLYGPDRSTVFVDSDSTEKRFRREASNFRILHLATHSLLDDSHPMYSQIVLALPGRQPPIDSHTSSPYISSATLEDDGLLEGREVMNLKLNADLVVLSACETASGGLRDGEGMIGLTWAFFAAGVPTTVASQWRVNSKSTTELMIGFHTGLKPGMLANGSDLGTAAALRQATLKIMQQDRYNHPYFWAGFIVVGDGR